MSFTDVEARFKAEQQQIDDLERQLSDLVGGQFDRAIDKYQRFADAVARARQFVETIETRAS